MPHEHMDNERERTCAKIGPDLSSRQTKWIQNTACKQKNHQDSSLTSPQQILLVKCKERAKRIWAHRRSRKDGREQDLLEHRL